MAAFGDGRLPGILGCLAFASLLGGGGFAPVPVLHVPTVLAMRLDGLSVLLLGGLVELAEGVELEVVGLPVAVPELGVLEEEGFFVFVPQAARFIALRVEFEFYINLHNRLYLAPPLLSTPTPDTATS